MNNDMGKKPYVVILEQPASKSYRFRYKCEGRSAGSILGVNSTVNKKSYPKIQLVSYQGKAVVVVSCVSKNSPYLTHPHNIVGKDCRKGVLTVEVETKDMTATFTNLGIQCVKRREIDESLKLREEVRVDPFLNGFAHRLKPGCIDLNVIRLCFQVFLECKETGKFILPLKPVVTDPIYDKKITSDLVICKLSHCSCTVAGGKEIILLCEKVSRDDISVRFYQEKNGQVVWENYGQFTAHNVHKQVAIALRTPVYRNLEVNDPIPVNIQLKRPSDGQISEPLPFDYLPMDSDAAGTKRKRQKYGGEAKAFLRNFLKSEKESREQNTSDQNCSNNVKEIPLPVDTPKVSYTVVGQDVQLLDNATNNQFATYNLNSNPTTNLDNNYWNQSQQIYDAYSEMQWPQAQAVNDFSITQQQNPVDNNIQLVDNAISNYVDNMFGTELRNDQLPDLPELTSDSEPFKIIKEGEELIVDL